MLFCVLKMGIKKEVLWNFKISWQTLIQQKYFSGTKHMEVSFSFHNATKFLLFLLLVLAVKKKLLLHKKSRLFTKPKGTKLDIACLFLNLLMLLKFRFAPRKVLWFFFFFPICRNSKNKVNLRGWRG